jgi:NAD-dependent deacetylase
VNPEISRSDIVEAAELILRAESVVALTGAGISTPSGIPDFRSLGSGLWEIYNPMEVASLTAFRYNPEKFFDWAKPLASKILIAEPNNAHYALAQMEAQGFIKAIITQNIDTLHTRAGSKKVLEIHGHMRKATCINCFQKVTVTDQIQNFVEHAIIPKCEKCGGILKPDFVLFGEQLPFEIVKEARKLIHSSDLMLVLGSSLEVVPVAYYPVDALNSGGKLIIINHEPTYLDERASIVFHHDVAKILPDIAAEVLNERHKQR